MAAMLKHLHQNQKAGGVYLKKIEVDRYAEKFMSSINRAEMVILYVMICLKDIVIS